MPTYLAISVLDHVASTESRRGAGAPALPARESVEPTVRTLAELRRRQGRHEWELKVGLTGRMKQSYHQSMKLSVSVPDPLWHRATELRPELNPSHLVQAALERLVDAAATATLPIHRPTASAKAFIEARDRLLSQARSEFEEGYSAALEAVEKVPLWSLESLATRFSFDVKRWASGYASDAVNADLGNIPKEWAPDSALIGALGRGLGSVVSPFFDDSFSPSVAYVRGFSQALRDLWTDVYEGGAMLPADDEPPMGD